MAVGPDGVRGEAGWGLARAAGTRWGVQGGGFREGDHQVLRFIAEAAFGEPPSPVKDLFMW